MNFENRPTPLSLVKNFHYRHKFTTFVVPDLNYATSPRLGPGREARDRIEPDGNGPCASGMDTEIFKTVIFNEYEKDR